MPGECTIYEKLLNEVLKSPYINCHGDIRTHHLNKAKNIIGKRVNLLLNFLLGINTGLYTSPQKLFRL